MLLTVFEESIVIEVRKTLGSVRFEIAGNFARWITILIFDFYYRVFDDAACRRTKS